MKDFLDMTKAELLAVINQYELNDSLSAFGQDPKKIKNDIIINILEAFKAKNDGTNVELKDDTNDKPKIVGVKMGVNEATAYLNTAIPVVVVDHDRSFDVDDDTELRAVEISWSNPIIGCTTEKIYMHGRRQFLTRGLLKTMRTLTIPKTKIESNKMIILPPVPRFSITEVDGFTDSEWAALKKKEAMELVNKG